MTIDTTFLTLRVFSATGGIEKVCRIAGKALYETTLDGSRTIQIISSHDTSDNGMANPYFPSEVFVGCNNNRFHFIKRAVQKGMRSKNVLLSHINLLPVGWLIKKLNPSVKLSLLAHGIEVWSIPLGYKQSLLQSCDQIICVSEFTRKEMGDRYQLPIEKMKVLNNSLDPFMPYDKNKNAAMGRRAKYGLSMDDQVIFTLTRMESSERYKGYDRVIDALAEVQFQCPRLKYLIGGSYAPEEKLYIDQKIKDGGLAGKVLFTGFIPDEDLPEYFLMSDYYCMPSFNEGFGIVFIEALYYGLPVVAGNKDGSVDALDNGNMGLLIDPLDIEAIKRALMSLVANQLPRPKDRKHVLEKFGYDSYKVKLEKILFSIS